MSRFDDRLRKRVDELANVVLLGDASAAERAELVDLLEQYEEAREIYLLHAEVESVLCSRRVRTAGLPVPEVPSPAPVRGRFWVWRLTAVLAFTAVSLGVLCVVLALREFRPQTIVEAPMIVGRVTRVEDVVLVRGQEPQRGGPVAAGFLEIEQGILRMQTHDGVAVAIEGPAVVEFLDRKTVRLQSGRLVARVPHEGIGFQVITPTANVVDMGTEFGVAVEDGGDSEVHVFDGCVVARPTGSNLVMPLYGNEAGLISAIGAAWPEGLDKNRARPAEIVAIDLDRNRFVSAPRAPARPELEGALPPAIPATSRVLFVGELFDVNDTKLILEHAWRTAGINPAPKLITAAVPDSVAQYLDRFEQHVLRYEPTHLVLGFGMHNAIADRTGRTRRRFRADLLRLCERAEREGIEVVLCTVPRTAAVRPDAQEMADWCSEVIRDLAREGDRRLADVARWMEPLRDRDVPGRYLAFDRTTFEGQRVVAAALLPAFGDGEVAVPRRVVRALLPGVLTEWSMRRKPVDERLTPETVDDVAVDETWTALKIPQRPSIYRRIPGPIRQFRLRARRLGFATHLLTSNRELVEGVTTLEAAEPRDVFFNTGGSLRTVWLNGRKIYDRDEIPYGSAWHAGKERVPARLQAGRNEIVIEAGTDFFLSVTDNLDW